MTEEQRRYATQDGVATTEGKPVGALQRWVHKAWWLHSIWALAFGVGVMIFARKGLAFADSLLMVAGLSFLLMFIALRFIVGPANRSPEEKLTRKGVRLLTNYIIKNLYQQMFFFLVPLYASSATWSLASYNWWIAPVLLVFAVLSTMDLVFDNFIMERRALASIMYGIALFGVLNLMLPLVVEVDHFTGLLIAAAATAPAVALLTFTVRSVLSLRGLFITVSATCGLVLLAFYGRAAIPPAPMSMPAGAAGHGSPGSYECLPASKRIMPADQLDGLRCGSLITEPGGLSDELVHVWRPPGTEASVIEPRHRTEADGCDGDVFVSTYPQSRIPADPTGRWECVIETADGQLVGVVVWEVVEPPDEGASDGPGEGATDGGAGPAAPAGDAGAVSPDAVDAPPGDGGTPLDSQRGEHGDEE